MSNSDATAIKPTPAAHHHHHHATAADNDSDRNSADHVPPPPPTTAPPVATVPMVHPPLKCHRATPAADNGSSGGYARRPPAVVNGIAQDNGGDQDADNNGGPSDGDGNL